MDFTIDAYKVNISNVPMGVLTFIAYSNKRTLQVVQIDTLPTLHKIFNVMTTFTKATSCTLQLAIYKHQVTYV